MTGESLADRSERRDRAVNQFELVSRWADDLAHEIKNPFHAMAINLELVKRRAGDADALRDRTEVVESELHRVHDLMDAVLKLVRPWPEARAADVDAVFEALGPVLRARTRLRGLEYRHSPGGGPVAMPAGDLALVILNLVDNAVDALAEDGGLLTRCAGEDPGTRIEVADTGPGLEGLDGDPFEPGVTSRYGRSGLGLAVSRRLVRRAGGGIELAANPDGPGLTAVVTLPRPGAA